MKNEYQIIIGNENGHYMSYNVIRKTEKSVLNVANKIAREDWSNENIKIRIIKLTNF